MLGDMAAPVAQSSFHAISVLATCSPLVTWISGFLSSCCCPGAPAPPPQHLQAPGPSVWMFLVSRALFLLQRPMHMFLLIGRSLLFPSFFRMPCFFPFPEDLNCLNFFFHAFLLFLKDSFWPCWLRASPPAFIKTQGSGAHPLPGAHPSPMLFSRT